VTEDVKLRKAVPGAAASFEPTIRAVSFSERLAVRVREESRVQRTGAYRGILQASGLAFRLEVSRSIHAIAEWDFCQNRLVLLGFPLCCSIATLLGRPIQTLLGSSTAALLDSDTA
jgi:hypothetical protein